MDLTRLLVPLLLVCVFLLSTGDASTSTCPDWSYTGTTDGPSSWGSLCEGYKLCSTGTRQCPIDLSHLERHALARELKFDYSNPYNPEGRHRRSNENEEKEEIEGDEEEAVLVRSRRSLTAFDWNGRHLTVAWAPGSSIAEGMFDRVTYNLYGLQFHAPSEFTHDGHRPALGMYLMHDTPHTHHLAIIYIPFDLVGNPSQSSGFLKGLLPYLPTNTTSRVELPAPLPDIESLVGQFKEGYTFFQGSLTYPPCTEDVTWIVPSKINTASEEEIRAFTHLLNHNIRPIQPTNGRKIEYYSPIEIEENTHLSKEVGWIVVACICAALIAFFVVNYGIKKKNEPSTKTLSPSEMKLIKTRRFYQGPAVEEEEEVDSHGKSNV